MINAKSDGSWTVAIVIHSEIDSYYISSQEFCDLYILPSELIRNREINLTDFLTRQANLRLAQSSNRTRMRCSRIQINIYSRASGMRAIYQSRRWESLWCSWTQYLVLHLH